MTSTEAEINSLPGLPAETETTTSSSCILAERSARSNACRMAASAASRSTTAPAFMPRASVWPKPTTSMLWLRRRSTSCGAFGLSFAIRQAILLVPTSSTATSAERFGDSGLVFGVMPCWRGSCLALLLRLLVLETIEPLLRGRVRQAHRHAVGQPQIDGDDVARQ